MKRLYIVLLALCAMLLGAAIITQGYSIVQIVTLMFIEKSIFSSTYVYFALLAAAMIVRVLMQLSLQRLGGRLAERVKRSIRQQLLAHWANVPLNDYVQFATGEKVTLLIQTVDELDSYYREYIPQLIKTTVIPVMLLIAVFSVHPNSGWIMLITAPFVPLTYILIGMQTQKKAEEQLEAMNRFSGTFLDLLQGLQTIRLFGQQHTQRSILAASNEGFMTRTLAVLKIAFASTLFIELIATLGIGLVALEIGFQMIVFTTLTFAPAFFVLTLAPEYYNSLKELGAAFHTGRGSLGASTLIKEELAQPLKTVQWGDNDLAELPTITLREATLRYDDVTTVGPVSLTIAPNDVVALIGQTGHGKTTLLNMLSSFAELTDGDIYLNDLPRSAYRAEQWYAQISYISQHPHIFASTLRDNICMGLALDDATIMTALDKAQLTNWVQSLPNGLQTHIGEGGLGLSGGEKQRVALARAFVKNARIVFFDEPTAAIDVVTERLLMDAIEAFRNDATVIFTAHKVESIRRATVVYKIENGRIVASGAPAQFLKGDEAHENIATHHLV